MARWVLGLGVLAAGGCSRDPVWFGYWDLVEGSRDGVVQRDLGTIEFMRSGPLAVMLRYEWDGAAFVPDPTPAVLLAESNASEPDDLIDGAKEKDETYTVYLSPFCVPGAELDVVTYTGDHAVLASDASPWPGRPEDELAPITLELRR